MKPARKHHRALAEMAAGYGVVNGVRKHNTIKRKDAPAAAQKKN